MTSIFESRINKGQIRPERSVPLPDSDLHIVHVADVFIGDAGVRIAQSQGPDVFIEESIWNNVLERLAARDVVFIEYDHPVKLQSAMTNHDYSEFISIDLARVTAEIKAIVIRQDAVNDERLCLTVLPLRIHAVPDVWAMDATIPFKIGMRAILKDKAFTIITFDVVADDGTSPHQILTLK